MSGLKFWGAQDSIDLLSMHRQRLVPAGALSAANALARGDFEQPPPGQNGEGSTDVRGQNLRQLRLQRNLDPAVLATRACISLRQLQQLETGQHSLFYSIGLRNQAGRRVATLLGAQWDELGNALLLPQDKHLKLVTAPAPDTSPGFVSGHFPTGLGKPADDTLVVQAEAAAGYSAHKHLLTPSPSKRPGPPAWVLACVLLALLAISGMAALALRDGRLVIGATGGQVSATTTPAAQAASTPL